MTSICRLCLLAGPDLAPISELTVETGDPKDPESFDLSELVARYLSIEPLKDSIITESVCSECRITIANWHWFRETCLRNDAMYQKMTQDPDKDDPVEETFYAVEIKEEVSDEYFETAVETALEQECLPKNKSKKKAAKKRGRPPLPEHEKKGKCPPQMCTLCGKLVSNMASHLRMHNQDRCYQCPHCPKNFYSQSSWKNHVNVHTKEVKFSCSVCGAFFWRYQTLKTHMLNHSEARPYKCKLCPKTYCSRSGLVDHRKTHTQPPDISCPGCDKKFYRKDEMKKHCVKHMEEKPFICKICGRGYTRKNYLRVHMERDHPKVIDDNRDDKESDSEEIQTE